MNADRARRRNLLASLPLIAIMAAPAPWLAGCQPALQAMPLARRDAAPSFRYTLLDGSQSDITALRGQVVLVNFWATTCAICVQEMPLLSDTHRRFRPQGLATLAVAMQYDPPALVASFAQRRQLPFDVVIDNTGAIARAFGEVRGTPTSVLIDRRGAIAARFEGAVEAPALHQLVQSLLAEA
jgi:peroxiredoxin